MTAIPPPVHSTAAAIFRWYEEQAGDGLRLHFGGSEIGGECELAQWYSFRWAEENRFSGRLLRLFETGKLAEPRVYANLRAIGCQVFGGEDQHRVSAVGGHAGGSLDGAVLGIEEAPKTWHLLEVKTHAAKSFADLSKKGVKASKPQHYAQMQWYCGLAKLTRWLYFAINKDTDELHIERGEFDQAEFDRLMARAERVIGSATPLPRLSDDPEFYVCKMCRFKDICHSEQTPLVNCRTCSYATPLTTGERGTWTCSKALNAPIAEATQRTGCTQHRYIPAFLTKFAEPVDFDAESNTVFYRNKKTGETFANGEHPGVSSADIRAIADKGMLGQECADPFIRELRLTFGASYAA